MKKRRYRSAHTIFNCLLLLCLLYRILFCLSMFPQKCLISKCFPDAEDPHSEVIKISDFDQKLLKRFERPRRLYYIYNEKIQQVFMQKEKKTVDRVKKMWYNYTNGKMQYRVSARSLQKPAARKICVITEELL